MIENIGLSSKESSRKLIELGFNELISEKSRSLFTIIFELVKEPMFLLLLIAGFLYILLGDFHEGLVLIIFVAISISFTIYQEAKSEHAILALKQLSSPRTTVMRDGVKVRVPSREIVTGDIIFLNEGDRVTADCELIESQNLEIDESLLTGESLPVSKEIINKELIKLFSGSLVIKGYAKAQVQTTGMNSEIGKIGNKINQIEIEKSTLSQQTTKLITQITIISLALSFLLIIIYGLIHGKWIEAILSGIALSMAMLPQEFVIMMTLFPALGAFRLSKKNVLARRLSSIETLGAISTLCVDKTGTLTANQMSVQELFASIGEKITITNELRATGILPESFHALLEFSILASKLNPFDPMENAFHQMGKEFLKQTEHLHSNWQLMKAYELTPELKAMSHVWKSNLNEDFIVAAKGSPEAIIDLCHLENTDKEKIKDQVDQMALIGLRILAIAEAKFKGTKWPLIEHDFNFKFHGLIGLADPLRPEITKSIIECHNAGIKILMITGDYPITAKSIAMKAGMTIQNILTGDKIDSLNDHELEEALKNTNICARTTPFQKLRIVEALKNNGEITAMTGDGINDAPALKAAHVGIAMGERGTDVAREAASIILLDDNFTSIINAIQFGRRIFDNIQKSMTYIIAIHIPIAGMALLPVLLKFPTFLFPTHIAFLELLIDPACSMAFENEPAEPNIMTKPPRNTKAPLMNKIVLTKAFIQGGLTLTLIMISYWISLKFFIPKKARTFTFVILVISNLAAIFSNRSKNIKFLNLFLIKNKTLQFITILTLLFLFIVIYIPLIASIFRFSPLSLIQMLLGLVIGGSSFFIYEFTKKDIF